MKTNEKVALCLQRLAVWRTHSQQMRRLEPGSSITLQESGGGKRESVTLLHEWALNDLPASTVCTANTPTTASLSCNEGARPLSECVPQPWWRALEAYHVRGYATRQSAGMTIESSDKVLVQPPFDLIAAGFENGVSSSGRNRSHANDGSSAQEVSSLVLDCVHHPCLG
jgi:hypothetical protein